MNAIKRQPRACNIGPAEIARRRRSAVMITGVAVLVAVALVGTGQPPVARLALLPFAAGAAVTWLQVVRRFCVAFGAAGIRNFGRLGESEAIADDAERAADRRVAARMIGEGLLYGAVATAIVVLLPM
jgi:hypothetical protein